MTEKRETMNKKELMEQINAKIKEVKDLVDKNQLEDAKQAKGELNTLQEKYDLIKDFEGEELEKIQNGNKGVKPAEKKDAVKEFAQAARMGFPKNTMSEGSDPDGGYTVPKDIQTKIEKYRDSKKSLRNLVRVKQVTTKDGRQTFKKRAQQTGFSKVGEGGKIGKKNTPQFETREWSVDKYAGYFPVTNELLEDSDANIASEIIEWIGEESRVTDNKIILEAIKLKETTEFNGLDDMKKAVNVTLGAAFKSTSKIITNDDGLQYLDTLKDKNGNYILRHNPADPMEMHICAGATTIPIEVYPNADIPSDTSVAGKRKIPMIIGDLKEYAELKDKKQLSIKISDVAVIGELNAYEEDLTLWRAIVREGIMVRDEQAIVNGVIVIDDNSIVGE